MSVVSVYELQERAEDGKPQYKVAVYDPSADGYARHDQPRTYRNLKWARGDARQYARFMGYAYEKEPPE